MALIGKLSNPASRCEALETSTLRDGTRRTIFTTSGDHYIGEWKNNLRHGWGTQVWKRAGVKYEGTWKKDQRHGIGNITKLQESTQQYVKVYSGNWKNNKKEGFGTYFYTSSARYDGVWVGNERSGWGKMIYENGDEYEGQWLRDKPNGQGVLLHKNGNRYEGYMKDGKKHGLGKLVYKDSGKVIEGLWKEDIMKCGTMFDDKETIHTPQQNPIPPVMLQDVQGVLNEGMRCVSSKKKSRKGSLPKKRNKKIV